MQQYIAGLGGPPNPAAAAATAKAQETAAVQQEGRQLVTDTVSSLKGMYGDLKEAGAIPNAELGIGGSMWAKGASTGPGQFVGAMFGTEASRTREAIKALTPSLLVAVKQAEGLGAKMFDSNKDMEFFMSMLGDPSRSYEANMAALEEFERKYGAAMRGEPVTPINPAAAETPAQAVPATVQMQVGTVVPGVGRYKGGDVHDLNNYEPEQ